MGYDLHITRAKNWAENQNSQISAKEWLSLIETDKELTLDTANGPYFASWSGGSSYDEPWFNWAEGNIETKYPDRPMLGKMLQMADSLGAIVQGDDGELYRNENDLPASLPRSEAQAADARRLPPYLHRERLWTFATYGTIVIVIMAAILLDLW